MGMDGNGTVLVACHTFEETTPNVATVRLISARKATKHEVKQYRRT